MLRWLFVLLLIPLLVGAQTNYYLPVPIESSNGRPILDRPVAIYSSDGVTLIENCTWQDGGRYYVTDISSLPNGRYDIKINTTGAGWITLYDNIYLAFSVGGAGGAFTVIADTTSLVALTITTTDSAIVYLQQLSSTNDNGSGFFVQMDSAYPEGISYGIAYANATEGKQWVRTEYLQDNCARLEWLGAKGDGTTNDRTALYNAFNSGLPLIGESGKTYYCLTPIKITDKDINIKSSGIEKFTIRGDTSLAAGGSGLFLEFNGSTGSTTTVTDTIGINSKYCIVTDPSLFAIGDLITITSNVTWFGSNTKGELHKLINIIGDTLWIEDSFWDTYDPATETITITDINSISIRMENVIVKIDSLPPDASDPTGLYLSYVDNLYINNCEVYNFCRQNIIVNYSYNSIISNTAVKNANATVYGYGIIIEGCNYALIEGCYFQGNYKGLDMTGTFATRNVKVVNNYFSGSGFTQQSTSELYSLGIHTHNLVEGVSIIGNTFNNCSQSGITFKGWDAFISDNHFHGKTNSCIYITRHGVNYKQGGNVVIDNNYYSPSTIHRSSIVDTSLYYNTATNFITMSLVDTNDYAYFYITNNKIFGLQNNFLLISMASANDTLSNLVVANNVIRFYNPDNSEVCQLQNGGVKLKNGRMINNDVKVLSSNTYTKVGGSDWKNFDWSAENEFAINDTITARGYEFSAGTLIDYYWHSLDTLKGIIDADTVIAGTKPFVQYSLDFERADSQYVLVSDSTVTQVSTGNFAMGFWVKLESNSTQQTFYSHYDTGWNRLFAEINSLNQLFIDGKPVKGGADSVYISASSSDGKITDTNWHWVAFSVDRSDSNNCFIYLDGDSVTTYDHRDEGGGIDLSGIGYSVILGRRTSTSGYLDGLLKNFVFWKDTTISLENNSLIYECGLDADFSKKIGKMPPATWYWDFREGEGDTTRDRMLNKPFSFPLGRKPTWSTTIPTKDDFNVFVNKPILADSIKTRTIYADTFVGMVNADSLQGAFIDTSGITTNDILKYDGTKWTMAQDATGAGGSAYTDSVAHDGRNVVGDSLITDAEGAARYQPLEATLTDIADGTIAENLVNTANPWADTEVADNITASSYLPLTLFDDSLDANDNTYMLKANFDDSLTANEVALEALLELASLQGELTPDKIQANGQTDEYVLTYEATGDSLVWEADATGAGGAEYADSLTHDAVHVSGNDFFLESLFDDSLATTKSDEVISDFVGTMVTGNTETQITVTYQDADNTIDFVVAVDTATAPLSTALAARLENSEVGSVVQAYDAQLADLADGTLTGDFVNTAYPWADNEVADNITASSYLPLSAFNDSLAAAANDEIISDFVGTMLTGNTETGITVTYQDADNTIDFVVAGADSTWDEIAIDSLKAITSNRIGLAKGDTLDITNGAIKGISNVVDLDSLETDSLVVNTFLTIPAGSIGDAALAAGAVDGGTSGEIADASITAADLATDAVSADELNATGVEAELEAVLDLAQLQGELTPDNIQNKGQVDEYVLTYEATGDSLVWEADATGAGGAEYADSLTHDAVHVSGNDFLLESLFDDSLAANITIANYLLKASFDDSLATTKSDEIIADFVGTMVTGNTETKIAVDYQDADNTLDFVVTETDPTVDTDDEIIAIINASPGTQIGVPAGGSGAGTFTDGGILLGSGTGAFTALGVATNGQIPIGDGTTDPVLATITAGKGTVITNGAGTIKVAVDTLKVANGGSGGVTFTDGGILLGSGTGAFTALGAATNGQIPIGDGTTDPVLATISQGKGVVVTNGAGTIKVAVDTLKVANGGTGATTLTDGGILLGSGTGAITPLGVASNGQIPIGDGTTDPVLGTLTAAGEILVTNGAGTITVSKRDTLTYQWGVLDTVIAQALPGWKVPYAITIVEIASYTEANTTTFNIEERAEATPNTAGTDALAADQVADTNQQEATSFSNAGFAKDTWMVPVISATGDVSIFSITVRYVKD